MGEPDRDEVIDVPEADDVHAEVCIRPDCHREDSGFSNDGEDNVQHKLSELEDKLYRRCFDKVDDLCGDDKVDAAEEEEANNLLDRKESTNSMVDKRRDGKISVVKLQKIISRLEDDENPLYMGPAVKRMDQKSKRDIVHSTLNEIDKNQDGYICYEEFKMFVAKVRRSQIMSTQKSRHDRVMDYFHIIGHGRVISKWPPPFFISSITIIQISLFLAFTYTNTVDELFEILEFNPSKRGEVWRYLSYCLVHQNWEHIIINTVLQLLVGLLLEVIHKWKRVAPIYILGVLTASFGYYLVDHYSLIGASGGIYCLIAACVPDIIVNWKESRAVFVQRYRRGHVAHACDGKLLRVLRLFAVLAFALFDIGYNLAYSGKDDGVSVWAHLFGCLAGVMFGLVLLKDSNEEDWEKKAKRVSGTIFAVIFLVMIGLNVAGFSNLLGAH